MKLQEGNVFSRVYHSVCPQRGPHVTTIYMRTSPPPRRPALVFNLILIQGPLVLTIQGPPDMFKLVHLTSLHTSLHSYPRT